MDRESKETHAPGPLPRKACRAITDLLRGAQASETATKQSQDCTGLSPVVSWLAFHGQVEGPCGLPGTDTQSQAVFQILRGFFAREALGATAQQTQNKYFCWELP